ncbi:MAG: DUF362 domain-containing protein [Peptococcaceae bacterium]|nr:DUF362 domain-containing protein [Peptococcaceae bacterium]
MAGIVSIVKNDDTCMSLKKALDLCGGLEGFRPADRILIKPNLVAWDFDLPFPPFGVVTTSAVMHALVRILHEGGYTNLTIGEASLGVSGSVAKKIFEVLGYHKLREKYGVDLVDFNDGEFVPVDMDGFRLSIAARALESDKIISVPVLKTHNQCKVSLGIKNFKGCLDRRSKIHCHGKDWDLNHTFPRIVEKLPAALTVIDGIFTLAKGPGATGKAFRKDILVASRDVFACDVVGAALLGYDAGEVDHLAFYARRNGRRLDLSGIEVRGETVEAHRTFVESDWEWTEDNTGPVGFRRRGISGIALRKYDNSLCTACSKLYNPMLVLLMSAFKGDPFPGIEVLTGKRQEASPGFKLTVLFGKCAYLQNRDNPNIKKAVAVKGCPPDLKELERLLAEEGISCDYGRYVQYRRDIYNRYMDKEGFDLGLYEIPA